MHHLEKKLKEIQFSADREKVLEFFSEFRSALERGEVRAAVKEDGDWKVNIWVKESIMLGFKFGILSEFQSGAVTYFDKDTLPLHHLTLGSNVRLVPGGSSIRGGSFVSEGTILMPPAYINIGAYIDSGCMIDSHALVGSCAQVGRNVHLSAASQIGGVLEPVGALPTIIEDDVFIGGNCGIYEGTIIKTKAVIGTGVILNASTPVFDNVSGEFIKKTKDKPLTIPKGAVVVAGSRQISNGKGVDKGIHLYCPVIIKYRDPKTDAAVTLEDLLR
ncbi:2,3,4,5-tetrahydropyridine-2,6-dicarboxylate N-succinyltransferase [bacterium]|nr:MAG: 2,3,4,5-tetrahydropyridine-2,6-dicarboxylate N-succinyltransferase [bacterium]